MAYEIQFPENCRIVKYPVSWLWKPRDYDVRMWCFINTAFYEHGGISSPDIKTVLEGVIQASSLWSLGVELT